MPKQFYTERDIEALCKGGVQLLEVNDDVVLTEMAYEKARAMGMRLVRSSPENPPSAPVRPYISQKQAGKMPAPAVPPVAAGDGACPQSVPADIDLRHRIRDAVVARLGTQVDATLLDVIIQRVLASTGMK
jgi:hypothetical protein